LIAQPFPFLLHRCFDKTVLPNKLALLTLLTAVGRTCCFQEFGNQTDLVALHISMGFMADELE
jgi:hypothetical protein